MRGGERKSKEADHEISWMFEPMIDVEDHPFVAVTKWVIFYGEFKRLNCSCIVFYNQLY